MLSDHLTGCGKLLLFTLRQRQLYNRLDTVPADAAGDTAVNAAHAVFSHEQRGDGEDALFVGW